MKLVILILALCACSKPIDVATHNPSDYEVKFLFEKDGCKIYRFWDSGDHYFSNCLGGVR